MSKQMIIRIDDELKEKLSCLARKEGKTVSEIVRELIRDYLKTRDIGAYIDELWARIGTKLKERGATPKSIKKAIAQVREKGQ